jgi:hypothetical protein
MFRHTTYTENGKQLCVIYFKIFCMFNCKQPEDDPVGAETCSCDGGFYNKYKILTVCFCIREATV